jgi:hypothetical protein
MVLHIVKTTTTTTTYRSLRQNCLSFILHNFDAVSKTDGFEEIGRNNVDLVFEILKKR